MPSKKDKKRQHQLRAADKRRKEQDQRLKALVDNVVGAVKELHAAAEDRSVEPERFVSVLEKYVLSGVRFAGLTDPAVAAKGFEIADEDGRRSRQVADALRHRAAELPLPREVSPSGDVSPSEETSTSGYDPPLKATLLWWASSFYRQALMPVEADESASQAFELLSPSGEIPQLDDGGERRGAAMALASLRLAAGRAVQAGELALALCEEDPTDAESMALLANAASEIAVRVREDSADLNQPDALCGCASGIVWEKCCKTAEVAFYERLVDRSALRRLHSSFAEWAAEDAEVSSWLADAVTGWSQVPVSAAEGKSGLPDRPGGIELRADPGVTPPDGPSLGAGSPTAAGVASSPLALMAKETVWLRGPDPSDEEPSFSERIARDAEDLNRDSLIRRFADENTADADLSRLAATWSRLAETGLWQVEDAATSPGLWLTDISTRAKRWVIVEDSQRENIARWTVLAGNLVPDAGVWRSGAVMAVLHPREADRAAEMVRAATETVAQRIALELHLRGTSTDQPGQPNLTDPPAYGILATVGEPQEPESASMHHTVTGLLMPGLLSDVAAQRTSRANLTNSDGEPMRLIQAVAKLPDPESVVEALRRRPDFDEAPAGDGSTQLVWHGRELTADERDSTLAAARQSLQRQGIDPSTLDVEQGARRWVRANVTISGNLLSAEVNSYARLGALRRILTRAGVDNFAVTRRSDARLGWSYPSATGEGRLHAPGPPETERAWAQLWIDEPLPELGGATPRQSVGNHRGAVLLERHLRDLEHDSDEAVGRGEPATDTDALRNSLLAVDPESPWAEAFSPEGR